MPSPISAGVLWLYIRRRQLLRAVAVGQVGRSHRRQRLFRAIKENSVMTTPVADSAADYSAELWEMADALRGSMDAAEYKHVVLGLVFLKYISDAFDEAHAYLLTQIPIGADPEDRDEYIAQNIFWVPAEARWERLRRRARQPSIGTTVDEAMDAIERDNPGLRGVLPKEYARQGMDSNRLGQLIDLVGNIKIGDAEARSRDVLGRVYEYFLNQFASAEGRRGGEFYTPRCVVQLLVEMLQPYRGRVYDPCCGSSGMFVQSMEFIRARQNGNGRRVKPDLAIYGQEYNYTTWRLAHMNLAIRGIGGSNIAHGDTFLDDRFPDLRADYILANPPFNVSDWGGERLAGDRRWQYGSPPPGNANFAWVQHIIHHLATTGRAGFVLANGSMSSHQAQESAIRQAIISDDLVDCMVALPGQLFYSTQIPACLWFLTKDKSGGGQRRDRRGETLFIDARALGRQIDRTHKELTADDIKRISDTYHAWRGAKDGKIADAGPYADIPGFCKSAGIAELARHSYALTPGRYVGIPPAKDDGEPFADKMARLTAQWQEQQAQTQRLDAAIFDNLASLGYNADEP